MDFSTIIPTPLVDAARRMLDGSRRVAIVCHMTPDGDALGSSLGLAATLANSGRKATVITPDTPPKALAFMPGADHILIASRYPDKARTILADSDLVVCLDFNSLKRIDRLKAAVENSVAPRLLIDHHLDPEPIADVIISCPEVSSTCALLFILLHKIGWDKMIDRQAAECIYTGMLTDTGNFSYNSNSPDLYLIIAELLRKGIDKDAIYELVWNTNSANRLRICGYSLYRKMELLPAHSLALITLNRKELDEFGYIKGDTESLVNRPLSIPGCVWSVFMREDEDNYVKVSMRSKGDFPVNTVCEDLYGGGGHKNAAGGEFNGSLAACAETLLSHLDDYDKYLPDNLPPLCGGF